MRCGGIIKTFSLVFLLSTAQAHAVQISLSGDKIDRYFRILEHYVLPLMVVSTIVLFCGYVASRIYHRTTARDDGPADDRASRDDIDASPYDGTAAFLRELRATPPIEDAEPKREPRMRAQHPLLRKRAANAAAALRSRLTTSEERRPETPERQATADALRFDMPQPPAERPWPERAAAQAPRMGARPRFDPPDMFEPEPAPNVREAQGAAPAQPRESMEDAPGLAEDVDDRPVAGKRQSRRDLFADGSLRSDRRGQESPQRPAEERDPNRAKLDPPPVATTSNWWQDPEEAVRAEPSAAVVQSLKMAAAPSSADVEAARMRAGEIGDSLDYASGVLQQSATLLAERMQLKQGLEREDVRGMRIAGFERPERAEEDLRKLGGDVAQETLSAIDAVANFDNVLRRLEQMAEAEPLDEGWNDLLRTRISDTLYKVGQVRKTLGGYRIAANKPARSSDKHSRPGGASGGGPDRPVPVGRRRV